MDGRGRRFPNYMLIDQGKASLYDVLHLFVTGNVTNNGAILCPVGSEKTLEDERRRMRYAIALSILLQIVFRKLKSSVLRMGTKFEWLVNFVMDNNGIGGVLWRFLLGKLKHPDAKSASYRSLVSFLDGRMELDKNIKPGDVKYHAALSVMASKLAYENEETIKHTVNHRWDMELFKYFSCRNELQGRSSTQAFMFFDAKVDPHLIVVAFRGTEPFNTDDWSVDVDLSWYEIPGVGRIHGGFAKALGLQPPAFWPDSPVNTAHPYAYYSIRDALKQLLQLHPNAKYILAGHSLGGALAVLFPLVLSLHEEEDMLERLEAVYTFGQPRVGDAQLGSFMSSLLDGRRRRYFRFVYSNDFVPRLFFDDEALLFGHWSKCFYYDYRYRGQVLEEEPKRKYFHLPSLWNKLSCGVWEVVRGLLIGLVRGRDYREGWGQIGWRILALMIFMPGLAEHGLRDYVNCTRLGNPLVASPNKDD